MNIVFVERIFPLYRKAVFDIIYCSQKFLFCHTFDKRSSIKQEKAPYSILINCFHYSKKDSGVFLFLLSKIIRLKPRIIVHEFSAGILSKPLLLLYCRLRGIKLIFWGHMYDRTKGFSPAKSLLDRYRQWLWRKADAIIAYSQEERQLLVDCYIPQEKIFVAFNTVDTRSFLKVRDNLESEGKPAVKKRSGFVHEFNLTFIGRLYKEKQPELLLDLLIELTDRGIKSIAVHFVGDGEMTSVLKKRVEDARLENMVFFHGAIYDEALSGELLFCSDLMIMPGCVGLSVNHAFCFNCPVVTFKQVGQIPAHGPEIEYIRDSKTGFQIANHTTSALADVVENYLLSADLRKTMRNEIRNFIERDCSIEKMAAGVVEAIKWTSAALNK